ncbi:MAG TPA: PEP-CTERM sorting domain-containing protein [Bryobacteraceae bacterium]|nr:hypothetical protein [Bryobacterales bacterium]HRJ19165.1 PEP-CTERM sorting domain-containing protein [Bryobacteraceae bacterium]
MKLTLGLLAATFTLAASALASPITVTISGPYNSLAGAEAARNAWLGTSIGTIIEDFEGFPAQFPTGYSSLNTAIGEFRVNPAGSGGNPDATGSTLNEVVVLNGATTPFSGRFNTTPGGANWLDSNDITDFSLFVSVPTNTLYFFMTDTEDVGTAGLLSISARNASGQVVEQVISLTPVTNGASHFVGIRSEGLIEQVRWLNGEDDDGIGLDDFGIVQNEIPEPATYVLLGSALLGAAFFRRRRQA